MNDQFFILIISLCVLTFVQVNAMTNISMIPYPRSQYTKCKQKEPSWLCDQYEMLTFEQRKNISDQLSYFSKEGYCHCKSEKCPSGGDQGPKFVMMLFMKTYDTREKLYNSWSAHWKCDDAILFQYFNETKEVFYVRGTTLFLTLRAACMYDNTMDFIDDIHDGKSLFKSLSKVIQAMKSDYTTQKRCKPKVNLAILIPVVGGSIIVLIVILIIFIRVKGWKPPIHYFRTPYHAPHEPAELQYQGSHFQSL